jgi:hypothetical protein
MLPQEYFDEFREMHRKISKERKDALAVAIEYSERFRSRGIDVGPLYLLRNLKNYIESV